MRNNDLSDRMPPRWVFVYEGVVARLRPESVRAYRHAVRLRRWGVAASCWETEPRTRAVLWDLVFRRDYRFDLVTHLGAPMRDALERELAKEALPFANLFAMSPEELVQRVWSWPDVVSVVHGDPSRMLAYGARGVLVTDPDSLTIF